MSTTAANIVNKPQPPVDQAQRQRALDIHTSFVVSAPAGSGKTGLLTQRVLALLAKCDEPENLLAITFTKKAANEMQSRILQALRDAQQQPQEPEEDYLKTTWRLARAVLTRNTEREWQLFHCPQRLRITTIDSLCRSISQQMPFESKLGHTPEILDNPITAYEMAARDTLNQLNRSSDLQTPLIHLVEHFDNQLERVESLLIQLLAKRDQWLRPLYQAKDQRQLLELMLKEVIEEQLQNLHTLLSPISSDAALLADHAASNLQESTSPIKHCLGLTGMPATTIDGIPQWLGIAELLLTQKGELRKSATKAIGFLPADRKHSKEQQEQTKVAKQQITELLVVCKTLPNLEQQLHNVRHLPSPYYNDKQWQLLDSLTHVLLALAGNLTLAFQQLGKTDYLAVTLAALDALGEPDAPTDVALALDYKIQHILIDEFQDTSSTQLDLLQRLTAGWQPNDGRTLFIVGDAMQSCYGFRDANVGIFLNARQHGLGDIHLESVDLQVNFRSQKNIVSWVNQSFTDIFPTSNDSSRGAVCYSPSTSFNAALNVPAVQSHLLAYLDQTSEAKRKVKSSNRKEEAAVIVDIIRQHQMAEDNDSASRSIAILVRSKANAQSIIQALKDADITYQATEIDRLDTCMPVLDCLSLTKALLYPNDRLAWLAVLRAPWCGLDMSDLLALAIHNKTDGHWPLLLSNVLMAANGNLANMGLSSSGGKKLTRFAAVIEAALNQQKRHSLRRWIEGIWLSLGGTGLLLNRSDENNIDTFFGLLEHYEQGGTIPQWRDLENAVNQLYAKPDATSNNLAKNPPVQIMTIHKSKGLEFDTVILPSLDKQTKGNDKELILWLERMAYSPQTHQQEHQLLISPVNASGDDKDPIYQFIKKQHAEKDALEADRLLYVGCTRAIKHLHLVGYSKINNSEELINKPTFEDLTPPNAQTPLARLWQGIEQNPQTHRHIYHNVLGSAVNTNLSENTHNISTKPQHPNMIVSLPEGWQPPILMTNHLLEKYRGNNQLAQVVKTTPKPKSVPTSSPEQNDLFLTNETKVQDIHNKNDERLNLAKPDELLQREQRYIGTVIHLALQQITQTDYRTWNSERIQQQKPIWKTQLQQQGLPPLSLDAAVKKVQRAIENTLQNATGQWLLDAQHEQSATELALWDQHGQHIIDRTFIAYDIASDKRTSKKNRWIIDYKSSEPTTKEENIANNKTSNEQIIETFIYEQKALYQKQLQRYARLFKEERQQKNIPTRCALYFPISGLFVEVWL